MNITNYTDAARVFAGLSEYHREEASAGLI